MKASTMLIFLFFCFLSSCKSVPLGPHHHRTAHLHNEPQKCGINTQRNTNDEETNCACFEKGKTNILDVLTLNNGGNRLQRLVFFLYKDPVTNTIQLYSPKKEKQALFPDLALEQGDNIIYNVNTLTLQQLFDNNYAIGVNKPNNFISQGNFLTDIFNFKTQEDENSVPSVVRANGFIPEVELHADISHYPEEDNNLVTVHSEGNPKHIITNSKDDLSLDFLNSFVPKVDLINDSAYLSHEGHEGLQNIYLTFDKWFDEQMKRVQNTGQSPIKNVELPSLKHLIQKTLYENGLFVTKDGVLIDSTGKALDASNLKLRPILIGNSVAYDSLFAMKDGKYELPANFPYLEAVLVTLVYPPKILGVIPLGKKFVPRESYLKDHDYWASIARKRMRQCRSKQCFLENHRLYNYYVTHGHQTLESGPKTAEVETHPLLVATAKAHPLLVAAAEAHPLLVAAAEAHPLLVAAAEAHPLLVAAAEAHPLLNQSQQKSVQQLEVKLNVNPVPQLMETLKDNQSKQKPVHQLEEKPIVTTSRNRITGRHRNDFGILKALHSMVGSVWDNNKGETQRKEESGKVGPPQSGSHENKSTGDEEEDDLPGFRIIGGLPATSSGTPVSSKGRSGYPYYQSKMGYRV